MKGRILKEVPPDFAVVQYFEVCVCEQLGVSHHFVEPQNVGPPPPHSIDTALRKGPWPQTSKTRSLRLCTSDYLFISSANSSTAASAKAGSVRWASISTHLTFEASRWPLMDSIRAALAASSCHSPETVPSIVVFFCPLTCPERKILSWE